MPYANNKGADQPVHLRSLVSAFVIRCLDSIIPLVSKSKISSLSLASVAAQTGLCLTWTEIPKTGFLMTSLYYCKRIKYHSLLLEMNMAMVLYTFEPHHEVIALFLLRKLILQTRMCGHPLGLDVSFFVGPFVYFHTSCVRTAKALARLCGCAGSPEPSLVAYVISTNIS